MLKLNFNTEVLNLLKRKRNRKRKEKEKKKKKINLQGLVIQVKAICYDSHNIFPWIFGGRDVGN